MDEDVWYFQVGGCLGILPAITAFAGGWWYCAETYGFLIGFGLGWFPSLILATLVEVGFIFLWGPALATVGYFWILPALNENYKPPHTAAIATTSSEPDYSQMSDEELLRRIAADCGIANYKKISFQELKRVVAECAD